MSAEHLGRENVLFDKAATLSRFSEFLMVMGTSLCLLGSRGVRSAVWRFRLPPAPHRPPRSGRNCKKRCSVILTDLVRFRAMKGSWAMVSALIAAALLGGCRLPGYDGPVSQSVAASRQYARRGVAALERGDAAEAEQWLAKAVKSCPGDSEPRRHYAEALWQRGQREQALAQLREAVKRADEDPVLHRRMAEMCLELGQIDTARESIERAIDLNPKSAESWAVRGRILQASGQFREALADFHRALGLAPDDRQVLLDVAELHRRLEQPHRALQALQSLAETYNPGEEPQQVLYLTGLAQLALARYDDAAESLALAAERGPTQPELLYRWAEAQWLCGRADQAAALAAQALQAAPDHQPSRELLQRIELARSSSSGVLR